MKIIKSSPCLHRFLVLFCFVQLAFSTHLFADEDINVWVIDAQTQQMTTYSIGSWVDSYAQLNGFSVTPNLQVLVNGLPRSSVPMSDMQAGISIIGFGQADVNSNNFTGTNQLLLSPAVLASSETINVLMQVAPDIIAQGAVELRWQINGGALNSVSLTPFELPDVSGYISQNFYLVNDGTYEVQVMLYQSGVLISEATGSYSIVNGDPLKEKRDTDGDGVPDLIEAELGLDPLNSDLFAQSAGQGWSKFDIWLRCDELDINSCSLPIDTDCDGWSDFDESMRGTKVDDFILPPPDGLPECDEEQVDETYLKNKLALQDKPAAKSLYEIEYVMQGGLGSDKIQALSATQLNGIALYSLEQYVSNELLERLGVAADQLSPNILRENAQRSLESATWPYTRLGAAKTLAIRGQSSVSTTEAIDNPSQKIDMLILASQGSVDFKNFPATSDGQWEDIAQWRVLFKTWLEEQVVREISLPFTANTSLSALLFEAAIKEEASLASLDETLRLGEVSVPATWLDTLQTEMQSREETTLFAWYTRLADALANIVAYQDFATNTQAYLDAMPEEGTLMSEWLIARLRMPVVLDDQGCFVRSEDLAEIQADPDFFEQYLSTCPEYYTEVELSQWQALASQHRYLLRMTMYEEGATRISDSESLEEFNLDTDNDALFNLDEVLRSSYAISTYPWLADSDDDGITDSVDVCRIDSQNLCSGDPIEPLLALGEDLQLSLTSQGGLAMLEVVLSAPALEEISFNFFVDASPADGDTATDGVDFVAASGSMTFVPGQQSMLIPVSLLAGGMAENTQFRLTIEDITNARLASDDNVQIVNIMRTQGNLPDIMLAQSSYSIDERGLLGFDASESNSGIDDPTLTFTWQQVSGPIAALTNATTAMPSITAPVVQSEVQLVFSVTAQNAQGEQASEDLTVTVNPLDDPPVLIGEARYSVARSASLIIDKSDLLNFVSEPDGEVLMVTELVQDVTQGGTLLDSALSFEFSPEQGSGRQVQQLPNDPLDIVQWRAGGIAFRTADTGVDPSEYKVFEWTPQFGLQIVEENNTGYSGVLASPEQEILFYSRRDSLSGNTFFAWTSPTNGAGQLDTGGNASLFGAQVNNDTGELYHCMSDEWHYYNPFTLGNQGLGMSCSRFSSGQAQIDGQFCLSTGDGLSCTEDGLDFESVFTLPAGSTQIDRIFQNENHVLVLYNDDINQFMAHVDGQENGRLLYTFDDDFNSIQGRWLGDNFYTVLPIKDGLFNEGVQLFSWSEGDEALLPIGEPQVMAESVFRNEFQDFIVLGDNFLWMGKKDDSSYAKFLVNPETGEFEQVGDDFERQRSLHVYRDSALFSSERSELSFCNWFVLDESGNISDPSAPELEQVSCFGRFVYGDTLAYTKFDQEASSNEFFVKYGGEAVSSVQFVVRIKDENDNAVDLTVTIDITQGDE
jgi:hypothetical protein